MEKKYIIDNPKLMAEWNYEKNIGLDPSKITLGSGKKVWWKCDKGHEWLTSIHHRNKGSGCPYCWGRYAIKGENDLQTVNPSLAKEWNYDKNNGLTPLDVLPNSEKKVWWICNKGHEWQATIGSRTAGSGCPYCAGKKAIKGLNDLQTVNPSLASEWNYEKNKGLIPEQAMPSSDKKVWWICSKGHEWQALINNRNKGDGCPFCGNKKVLQGFNDLATVNPPLAEEWNYEKNGNLSPKNFTPNSGKKVWWICSKGHEWQAIIAGRNKGIGCPYCANKKIIQGFNDLATLNPNLANEWDYEKNGNLRPEKIAVGSSKKVWWKCEKGHEWQATIANRNYANNCPYCANKKAYKGYNDLQTVNPSLASEWNFEKNNELTPNDVLPNSGKKFWWICNKGHEWQATVASRNGGVGCPICDTERKTSLPEYAREYYLKKYGVDVIHPYKDCGYELDIYVPSMKIAIEYDGYFWHKNKELKDLKKNAKCKKDGIKLYRIREKLPSLNDSSLDYIVDDYYKDLQKVIKTILDEITNCNLDIDLKRDSIEIESLREYSEKENSLSTLNPTLAKEWNYEKNGKLTPENFTANSGRKVWWKCKNGHEWQSTISHRNNRGDGCPYCSGQKAIKGVNDLATTMPNLAKEWHPEKNNDLTPTDVKKGSGKKVWWICKNGHEYQAKVSDRTNGWYGCPYCSGRRVLKKYNDLETFSPLLAEEWNHEKNGHLKPENFSAHSGIKVWWKCKKGHEWQATINHRNNGTGCPYCSGRRVLKGFNDLQTVNSALASEWNFERNNRLTPAEVTPSSNKKVWWKCSKNHEWQASVNDRTRGNGCPYCSGRRVAKGENDLATINPNLAKEWNYEKNGDLKPENFTANSNIKVWWKCQKGHEWEAKIQNRNNGRGCPYCSGRKKLDSN